VGNMTQLSDGRWVPAQPIPYYKDTRSFCRKIWYVKKNVIELKMDRKVVVNTQPGHSTKS